jgi:hypothetical protein
MLPGFDRLGDAELRRFEYQFARGEGIRWNFRLVIPL